MPDGWQALVKDDERCVVVAQECGGVSSFSGPISRRGPRRLGHPSGLMTGKRALN
jgi:hypothetical protein